MRVRLEYGREGLDVELPDQHVVRALAYKDATPLPDPAGALADALARPTGTPCLRQLARGRRSACIVVCDITRPVPNALILAPVLRTLEESGFERDDILILIATGLHRPNEGDELIEIVGEDMRSTIGWRITMVSCATNTPIWATAHATCPSGSTAATWLPI